MHKQAEWYLYHYQKLKAFESRTRKEQELDAYYSQYGQHSDSSPVKSSNISSPTASAGMKLAASRGKELSEQQAMWIKAIENTWVMFTHEAPIKAALMERVFGLSGKVPTKENKAALRDQVMGELCIDRVQTFYSYKRDIISTVICCALEIKLLTNEQKKGKAASS